MIQKRKLVFVAPSGKRLAIKAKPAQAELPLQPYNIGSVLDRMGGILIKYPEIAKAPYNNDTSLSNVAWFYEACGNVVARKLADFCDYVENGSELNGRSWYLMVDLFKMAAYLYERESAIILSDSAWDRLGKFLEENMHELKARDIVPNLISEEAMTWHTGSGAAYSLKPNDIKLAKYVAMLRGVYIHGDQEKTRNSSTGGTVGGSTKNTGLHGKGIGTKKFLLKRPVKK